MDIENLLCVCPSLHQTTKHQQHQQQYNYTIESNLCAFARIEFSCFSVFGRQNSYYDYYYYYYLFLCGLLYFIVAIRIGAMYILEFDKVFALLGRSISKVLQIKFECDKNYITTKYNFQNSIKTIQCHKNSLYFTIDQQEIPNGVHY